MNDQCSECYIRKQCYYDEPEEDWTCPYAVGTTRGLTEEEKKEDAMMDGEQRIKERIMETYDVRPSVAEKIVSFVRQMAISSDTIEDLGGWVKVPNTGIGDLSDGYHTFNSLYYQRLVLFAALVKLTPECAWKSHLHEDGEKPFGGGWFIVGIDTPEGSYTYHYEDKDWDMFECKELSRGKHWDGHTEEDVTRLLSLNKSAD